MAKKSKLDKGRRRFLKLGVAAGAGVAALSLGGYLTLGGEEVKKAPQVWPKSAGALAPNVWLKIEPSGQVTVRVNHTEMGQGVTTAYAMIVAEELDADWSKVRAEIAPVESVYKNPEYHAQMTAGSTSVCTGWDILRKAGATARHMLLSAAARQWGVAASACRAEQGRVLHPASGRHLEYGALVEAAAKLPVPQEVRLKEASSFDLVGTSPHRLDGEAKAEGRAVFGLDVRLPGLVRAAMVHPPVLGAKPRQVDRQSALKIKGVRQVVMLGDAIAVVADTSWQALQGAQALRVTWDRTESPAMDTPTLRRRWARLAQQEGEVIYEKGEADAVPRGRKIVAEYFAPYEAHATPEPMNCTALVGKNFCQVWAPTQNQDAAQEAAARITGLPYAAVSVQTPFVGGGFGRRVEVDYVIQAVSLAKLLGAPVQVLWSREEDMRNDCYRPATHNRLEAVLGQEGLPQSWSHRIVGPDHMARMLPKLLPGMLPYFLPRTARDLAGAAGGYLLPGVMAGKGAVEGAAPLPYDISRVQVEFIQDDPGIPVGFWRSVSHSQNAFVVECFLDELAVAAGQDPVALRLKLLQHDPVMTAVLKRATQKSGWGSAPNPGRHRGVAVHEFHHTKLAFVAEVSVSPRGRVTVHRVVCALDCGVAVSPKNIAAQMESGIAFGLTATLKSSITVNKGRVEQGNLDNFPLLTMAEMPRVEVHILPSTQPPTAIGESAVPLIAPAVCNAVYAATKVRVRELPLDPRLLSG